MPVTERRLFIANRGEIALRIQQTAALFPRHGESSAATGTRFVPLVIYTKGEENAAHVQAVPPAQRIQLEGHGPAAYLDAIVLADLAKKHGAWGVAPGYGFLSESEEFAKAVEERGMVWIGPRADQLANLGDKTAAKRLAQECKMPVLQGTAPGRPASLDEVIQFADEVQKTSNKARIIIKALNGGGGRAMRIVDLPSSRRDARSDITLAYQQCQREARAAFGDERLYAERFLENARHIEVQIVGDGTGDVAHLWERECSLQRRHQKLIEIAPSPTLGGGQASNNRQAILEAAMRMAISVRYRSLGTFEFLYTPETGEFYFMEINPRIQVEHTITEQITGFDIVALQLQLALGANLQELGLGQRAAPLPFPRQTSIQIRINAEKFLDDGSVVPTAGALSIFAVPTGLGVRIDTAAHAPRGSSQSSRYVQTPLFDSLLAKVVVTAPSYALALESARQRLTQVRIAGLDTNVDFVRSILEHRDVKSNEGIHTRWVEERMVALLTEAQASKGSREGAQDGTETAQRSDQDDAPALPQGQTAVRSPLAGAIAQILVKEDDNVKAGQEIALIESMKMEHVVRSAQNGVIRKVLATKGQAVNEGATLVFLEADNKSAGASGAEARTSEVEEDASVPRPDLASLFDRRSQQSDEGRADAIAKRHAAGYLTARENIDLLVDDNSFIEWGDLAIAAQRTRTNQDELIARTSNDGVITGWATVNGNLFPSSSRHLSSSARCALCIYDYMVLAGTQGHFHHLKLDRLFRSVLENPAPLVLYAEGGGGRPGDVDLLNIKVGGLDTPSFALMAAINARGYPAIGLANGYTFAGNAALLGACHIVVATEGGAIDASKRGVTSTGMGGPAMIEGGGLGKTAPQDVGPVDIHRKNGDYDIVVPTEREAAVIIKKLLSFFQGPVSQQHWSYSKDSLALRTILPQQRSRAYEVRRVIDAFVDDESFVELGPDWGQSLVTGFARLAGEPVGVIASSVLSPLGGAIDAESARKATRHVRLLTSTRAAHLVVLCDTPGFMVGTAAEKDGGLRAFADFFASLQAFQDGSDGGRVFGITLRKAYGLGAQGLLGGSTLSNFFSVAWPQGEFAGMGIEGAVRLGMRKELEAATEGEEREQLYTSFVDAMYERGKAQNTAMIGEIDTVIDPAETRAWLLNGLRSVRPRIPTWQSDRRAHSSHL